MIAPVPLIRAAIPQATAGTGDPCSGMPELNVATSSRAAMPRAVPSCAAVLMIPEAVPRASSRTLVPNLAGPRSVSSVPAWRPSPAPVRSRAPTDVPASAMPVNYPGAYAVRISKGWIRSRPDACAWSPAPCSTTASVTPSSGTAATPAFEARHSLRTPRSKIDADVRPQPATDHPHPDAATEPSATALPSQPSGPQPPAPALQRVSCRI